MSKPQAPGYYLARYKGGEEIVEVFKYDSGDMEVFRIGCDQAYPLDRFEFGRMIAMTVESST